MGDSELSKYGGEVRRYGRQRTQDTGPTAMTVVANVKRLRTGQKPLLHRTVPPAYKVAGWSVAR